MKTAPTNPTALIKIFSSNIGEFLSFSIALANGLAKLTQPPSSLYPEQIFIEKENNDYIITIDTNNTPDDFSKNLFISPEINKEIDRDIDTRSLIYSLGIIFHLLLTKEYPSYGPFISVNFSANETVPQTIQLIIEKLLCRFPEDRYQSFSGLLSDHSKAKKDHEKTGNISPFFPGVEDKPIALNFRNYPYGRENEFAYIINKSDKCLNSLKIRNAFFIIHGGS